MINENLLVDIYEEKKNQYFLLADSVYQTLYDAIIKNIIPQGYRLKDSTLSDIFEISRYTARSALQQLKRDGLIEGSIDAGYTVLFLSIEKCIELVEYFRVLWSASIRLLEGKATNTQLSILREKALSVEKIQEYRKRDAYMDLFLDYNDFYYQIASFTHNRYLINEVKIINDKFRMMRYFYPLEVQKDFPYMKYAFVQTQIIESLQNKNHLLPAHIIFEQSYDDKYVISHMYNLQKEWANNSFGLCVQT